MVLVAGGFAAAAALVFFTVKGLVRSEITTQLEAAARIFEQSVASRLVPENAARLQRDCVDLGNKTGIRFTVIDRSGKVWCDSTTDPARMADHSDRPEVRDALAGRLGMSIHPRATLGRESLYVAVPLGSPGLPEGVVRVSLP